MTRAYYSEDLENFFKDNDKFILGKLTESHRFDLGQEQKDAWMEQIKILKDKLRGLDGHIMLEYSIPRMGKRVDVVLVWSGIVFVIEFKVGEKKYNSADIDQCLDYALDLKNFHEASHDALLVPMLVATEAPAVNNDPEPHPINNVLEPLHCTSSTIQDEMHCVHNRFGDGNVDPHDWENSPYKPTPTIIEAAQALYEGHSVEEISRSDAGAVNLDKTCGEINRIIEKSKKENTKSICFVTGVPGSGKTLAGLNLATNRHRSNEKEHAVFLSGNGPLVKVLQESLARNDPDYVDKKTNPDTGKKTTKSDALRKSKSFIQIVHKFRDEGIRDKAPPNEKVVIFDEAQRAWNRKHMIRKMREMKGIKDFDKSESEFLIHVMDRHKNWSVIVCLVGGGQEINTGEAGLPEWFFALKKFPDWNVYLSDQIHDDEYTRGSDIKEMLSTLKHTEIENLHLSTSIRSFRSENLSKCVKAMLDLDSNGARDLLSEIGDKFPMVMTRDIHKAKQWVRDKSRGTERCGLVASSKALRLKPHGVFVDAKINPIHWFLNPKSDPRSSYYLEHAATEFDIQGLELDWTCICWEADLRLSKGSWEYKDFRGKNWTRVNDERKMHIKNTYRVLLTRARQGQVIFVPCGDSKDHTRKSTYYNGIYEYLRKIGIREI